MPFGYNGKILHVDLNTGGFSVEEPPESWYRTYMGGGAVAAYYLLKLVKPGIDPLGPENPLVVACSIITGAPLSGLSRYTVAAKSPLTGGFMESEAGGYFGPELKFAGFDALIITGKSPKPVYLWIHNGRYELRDASGMWGRGNLFTKDAIIQETGQKAARVLSIGPAGERLIPFACLINELSHANGRGGLGAVFGSKNLKAIACRGDSKNQQYADPEALKALGKWQREHIKEHGPSKFYREYGTAGLLGTLNASGILPTRNWREGVFEGADKIDGEAVKKSILKRPHTCYKCAVSCKRVVEYSDRRFSVNPRFGGPEYETLAAMGSLCGVDDLPAIAKAHELCNDAGLDTISAGGVVAFAMECFEKGVLGPEDADGRKVLFGDSEGLLWLLEEIINRRGVGQALSLGVKEAAGKIGRGAERYAFHIKGQELPLHDPRGKTGVGFGMALSPTGADHIESPHETPFVGDNAALLHPLGVLEEPQAQAMDGRKMAAFCKMQKSWSMNNVLGLCNFAVAPLFALSYPKIVEAVIAVTGWQTSLADLLLAAERAQNMYRVFNNREGFGPEDDRLFRRMHQASPKGPLEGCFIDPDELRCLLDLYYEMSGWDEKGRPKKAKLFDLALGWLPEAQ